MGPESSLTWGFHIKIVSVNVLSFERNPLSIRNWTGLFDTRDHLSMESWLRIYSFDLNKGFNPKFEEGYSNRKVYNNALIYITSMKEW